MIDVRFVRENLDAVCKSQHHRGNDEASVDVLLTVNEAHGSALQAFKIARASQKELSRSTGKASPEERPAVFTGAKALAKRVKKLEIAADGTEREYPQANAMIQNIMLEGVPADDKEDYEILRHIGGPRVFGFELKDHLDVIEAFDAVDMARGMKVFGLRFYYLKGVGAWLEFALLTMTADQAEAAGFTTMTTPILVNPGIMAETGFLGAHSDKIYYLPADDQYLVGTPEVALTGYHKDEIVDPSNGSLCYAGWSLYYRCKTDPYGKDTRGIVRVYQSNKVGMFSYYHLKEAEEERRCFLAWEEEMFAKVELPYRIANTVAGNLGSSATRRSNYEA